MYVRSMAFLRLLLLVWAFCGVSSSRHPKALAELFLLGADANGITGSANASLTTGVFQMDVGAVPQGAVFNELDSEGLGIDTSGIAGVTDGGSSGDPRKFNIIDGTAAVSGMGETVTFSFAQNGILRSLLFDGLKDETLEYFSIEFPDASVISFFDFETELRLNQQGFQLSQLGVPNPTLADDSSDDFIGLGYIFLAGEEFTITYGEIDYTNVIPGYDPLGSQKLGNGARLSGIEVTPVPEPTTALLGLLPVLVLLSCKRFRAYS